MRAGARLQETPGGSRALISAAAGAVSGLLVLGVGGRLLMRLLAFATPEAPRFTWIGTVQIVVLGAGWGLVTGPLLGVTRARIRSAALVGPAFGLVVFGLAAVPFFLYSGFAAGPIVAPTLFLWLGALTFPLLFVAHGVVVRALDASWAGRPGRLESGRRAVP